MTTFTPTFSPGMHYPPLTTPNTAPYMAPYMAPYVAPYVAPTTNVPYPGSNTNTRYYFQPPPFVSTRYYKYINVNDDKLLHEKETTYFLNKTIGWIDNDNRFKTSKKYLSKLKSDDGYAIMHKLLKLFVRKGNTNWYDLKIQKDLVKDYIRHKLK